MLLRRTVFVFCFCLHLFAMLAQFKGKLHLQDFAKAHEYGIPAVYDLFQDQRGIIWLGSTNGIYRYDGNEILEFKGNDKKILGKTNYSFLEEKNGDLLIGSDYGVCRYDLRRNTVQLLIHLERPFDERNKYCLIGYDRQGYLWLSIAGVGIARYKDQLELLPDPEITATSKPDRLRQGYVDLATNRVYLGCHFSSPVYIDANTLQITRLDLPVLSAFKKIGNRLFLCSHEQLLVWDGSPAQQHVYPFPDIYKSRMKSLYTKVTVHDDSCLWISGMDGILVFNYKQNKFTDSFGFEGDSRSESLKLISELFTDRHGNTWICSETNGIKLQNGFFQNRFQYANGNQTINMTVMDLEAINDSLLLVCPLVNQPCLINLNTNRQLPLFAVNQETGKSFKVDRLNDTTLLLSSLSDKAYLFNTRRLKLQTITSGKNKIPFVKVLVTGPNQGYLLSYSQIFKFHFKDHSLSFSQGTNLGSVFNFSLLHDRSARRLVFSTREKSLVIDDSSLLVLKDTAPVFGAFNAYVFAKDGSLWLATRLGLKHYSADYRLIKTYSTDQGLNNDVIYALQFNHDSTRLYLSTNMGISEMDLNTQRFKNYSRANGLQESEHNSGAATCDLQGHYYFGNISGVTLFSEQSLYKKSQAPDLILTELTINDSSYRRGLHPQEIDSLSLKPDFSNLSVHFSLQQTAEPEQRRYAYQLLGLDNTWRISDRPPLITYPTLSPGHYTLLLRGCVGEACTEKHIQITVLPHFYQTWWFMIVAAVGLILVFFLLVAFITKARVRREEKRLETERRLLEQKNQISRDLHDNVGARLSMMLNTIDWMNKTNRFDPAIVSDLQDSTKSVIQNLRETIWVMNKEEISAVELFDKIKTYALQFFKNHPAEVGFSEHIPVNLHISSEQTLNLFRITQEVLNNILKYAQAQRVEIGISYEPERLFEIRFQDNGVGFDLNDYKAGNGILNMKERAEEIKAEFLLQSEPGWGTLIAIKFYSK